MNNSQFTIQELKYAIKRLVFDKKGITNACDLTNCNLEELSSIRNFFIDSIFEKNETVFIKFHQDFPESDDGYYEGETFRYETIQSINDIKELLYKK